MSRRIKAHGRGRSRSAHHRRLNVTNILRHACEPLEQRTLFTTTVFLDFGFNFAGGSITFGDGDMGGGVQGPTVFGASHTLVNLTQTMVNESVDLNGDTLFDVSDAQILANDILAAVQREYAPFDVNVQMASAANFTDVANTLAANGNGAGNRDAYIFVCGDDPPSNPAFGWAPVNIGNTNDNTGFAFANAMIDSLGIAPAVTALGRTAAHEAGHTFGLEHADGSQLRGVGDMLSSPEADPAPDMRDFSALHIFSRYPMDKQDDAGTWNAYDILAANIGLRPGAPAYITGTGAHDRITLTNVDANTVAVLVEPFNNANFTGALATYGYNVPKANGLLVDMGVSNDQLVVNANINVNLEVRGMKHTDRVLVQGNGAASASYTPDTVTTTSLDDSISVGGTVTVGGTAIDFSEFEDAGNITVQDVSNLTFTTPNSNDVLIATSPAAGVTEITGSSGGVTFVPLRYTNVANVTIDTAANDGGSPNDTIVTNSVAAAGLNSLTFNTGAGSDEVTINFDNGTVVPAGGLTFNAGVDAPGSDLLTLRGGSFGLVTYTPSGPDSGTINLDGQVVTYNDLAPIVDTTNAAVMDFNATAAADLIDIGDGPVLFSDQTTRISSGNGLFERVDFANKTTVNVMGRNGGDAFTVNGSSPADGLVTLNLYGQDNTNGGDDNANDLFTLSGTFPGIATSAFGGGGTDTMRFVGSGAGAGGSVILSGEDGNDLFDVTAAATTPVTVIGGPDFDNLFVDGQGIDYALTNNTFTSTLAPITYSTVNNLRLLNGTFEVVGNVSTHIDVHTDAILTGVGDAAGGIQATLGGIVSPGVGGAGTPGVLGSGNLIFGNGSNYTLDLNGTGIGLHDELDVNGTVTLANTATIAATVGFVAIPGDEIVIIRNDAFDAVIGEFGGGNLLDFGGGNKFTIDYGYDADGNNAFNDVALIRYGAALAPDPCDPTKMALFVSATSGADTIDFIKHKGNNGARVLINGVDEGTFLFDGHVYVMGQNGDDVINTSGLPSREVFIYGNTGNDQLIAGNNESILIGGFGNDILRGGNARDILIGGAGADLLRGENGTDILITGATTHDAVNAVNRVALCDLAHLWKHGHKPASLSGLLNAATLIADADIDTALGGNGKDYLILGLGDLDDREKQETILFV